MDNKEQQAMQRLNDSETFLLRLVAGAKTQEYKDHLLVAIAAIRAVRDTGFTVTDNRR